MSVRLDAIERGVIVPSEGDDEMNKTLITGNTYPVRESLRALGAKWDPGLKGWWVPNDRAEEARKLVANAPSAPKSRYSYSGTSTFRRFGSSSKRNWRNNAPCGYPGCRGYGDPLCDDCSEGGY